MSLLCLLQFFKGTECSAFFPPARAECTKVLRNRLVEFLQDISGGMGIPQTHYYDGQS